MASHIPKRERLMNLVAALFAAREPLAFREIVGRVVGYDDPAGGEALEKRFDRDKTELRRLGIPVEYVTGEGHSCSGYVIPRDRVYQQRVSFTPEEALLLSIAGRVGAAATGGGPLEEALKSALRKLAIDMPLEAQDQVETVTVLRTGAGDPRALQNVASLSEAVATHRGVAFSYRTRGEETDRMVDPYGLGLVRGVWYLVGWCHLREAVRVFRVSRILAAVKLRGSADKPTLFQVAEDFDLDDHLNFNAWNFGPGESQEVQLLVAAEVTRSGVLSQAQVLGEEGDRERLTIFVRRPEALVPWVLAQAGEVVIEKPQSLRAAVAEAARELLSGGNEELSTGGAGGLEAASTEEQQ